jgi:hypothetical protein
MAEKKPVKKMSPPTKCTVGNHTYIVTDWNTQGGRKKAIHMKCCHCLMPVDLVEIDNAKWFEVQS